VLIACFVMNLLLFAWSIAIVVMLSQSDLEVFGDDIQTSAQRVNMLSVFFVLPTYVLLGYCVYFFYKHDRYSFAGLKLLFLPGLYSPYYFYKVIWKRKRELSNTYEAEPVLGKSIHLEEYEDDEMVKPS
jgi:hypothetical protein